MSQRRRGEKLQGMVTDRPSVGYEKEAGCGVVIKFWGGIKLKKGNRPKVNVKELRNADEEEKMTCLKMADEVTEVL